MLYKNLVKCDSLPTSMCSSGAEADVIEFVPLIMITVTVCLCRVGACDNSVSRGAATGRAALQSVCCLTVNDSIAHQPSGHRHASAMTALIYSTVL